MKKLLFFISLLMMVFTVMAKAEEPFQSDHIPTSIGDLRITFVGHGTLMFSSGGKVIHVDPVGQYADYSKLPKADLILITHEHSDHFDLKALEMLCTKDTKIVLTEKSAGQVKGGIIMRNRDVKTIKGFKVEAIPAYNIAHMRAAGQPYHPQGTGNGYVITFGDKRIYIAGDTENTPEMKSLKNIYAAFLPMNLPYTMTPAMVADAAIKLNPKILYPYHFGTTDTAKLLELLKDRKDIEVRIREMK